MSVASVLAVSPVSAPPTRERRADEPLVLAAELIATVPVAVMPATVRLPEMRVLPWTESLLAGVVVPTPSRAFVVSKERRSLPMFQAFRAEVSEVVTAWLKLRKLFPMKMEPVPVWSVPLTRRLFSIVEVPLPPTYRRFAMPRCSEGEVVPTPREPT
jgi:hypothetical protein